MNPVQLENQLGLLARELEKADEALADLDMQFVTVDHEYEVAYAKALLSAEGSNADTRKASALLAVAELSWARAVAEQKVRAAKSKVLTLRTRIDVGRTLAASARTGWEVAGRGLTA